MDFRTHAAETLKTGNFGSIEEILDRLDAIDDNIIVRFASVSSSARHYRLVYGTPEGQLGTIVFKTARQPGHRISIKEYTIK